MNEGTDPLWNVEGNGTISVATVGKALVELDTKKKKLKKEMDFIQEEIREKSTELLLSMQSEQIDKISVVGKTLFPKVNLYASIKKEVAEEAFEWLKDNGYEELIRSVVNSQTLSSTVKGIIKEGGNVPENLFNVNEVTTVGIRKG